MPILPETAATRANGACKTKSKARSDRSTKSGRRYGRQLKGNAVALVASEGHQSEVSRAVGVSLWPLGEWGKKARAGQGLSARQTLEAESPEQREPSGARHPASRQPAGRKRGGARQLRRLRAENDYLRQPIHPGEDRSGKLEREQRRRQGDGFDERRLRAQRRAHQRRPHPRHPRPDREHRITAGADGGTAGGYCGITAQQIGAATIGTKHFLLTNAASDFYVVDFAWASRRTARDVNGARGFAVEEGIGEGDDVRLRRGEGGAECVKKVVIRRVIGPESEDAAWLELSGERAQSGRRIEVTVARVEEVARGVVDVEEDGLEAATGLRGIEARGGRGEGEEVAVDEAAAWIAGEHGAERDEAAPMPVDHGVEEIDDDQLADRRVLQRGDGGVTEPEAAHHHIARTGSERGEAEIGEGDFDFVEEARHEEVLPELHLEDLEIIERPHAAPAQGEIAERRFSEIEFGKVAAHRASVSGVDSRPRTPCAAQFAPASASRWR